MSVAIVTGASGLVGSECVRHFASLGLDVIGIDNDMRSHYFGNSASTTTVRDVLISEVRAYRHHNLDIRDASAIESIFETYESEIVLVIHAAAQPSHDWAARDPFTDFSVNANGTLNLLEATRRNCPEAPFIFTSTNKVYGDTPNDLPLIELETRWSLDSEHPYANGIPESMSIDCSTHSLFGVSKASADLLVQEYGRYFGMKTACFRCGCLTGPSHSGALLHGFLSYLVRCTLDRSHYTIFGYKGKQVRDNLHSRDLAKAFDLFWRNPYPAQVFNMGGGRDSNCSMLEAINIAEEVTGNKLSFDYGPENRIGDHIWWISDLTRFKSMYPTWTVTYDTRRIIEEIAEQGRDRWLAA